MAFRIRIATLFILFALFLSGNVTAQRSRPLNLVHYDHNPYNFGFTLAVNQMLFSIDHKPLYNFDLYRYNEPGEPSLDSVRLLSVESNPNWGFTIGIVANLSLAKYFDLRFIPSLSFGERDLSYHLEYIGSGTQPLNDDFPVKPIQSTLVEFPLYLKYKSKRLNNVRSYIIAGPKYSLDLISDARRSDKTVGTIIKLYRNDIYLDLGVGFDFYNEYFKFGTEIRMSYGLRNLLKKEATIFTDGIDQLRSKIFTLAFTFE